MSNSDDVPIGLLALLLLPFALPFIVLGFLAVFGGVAVFLGFWMALGVGANLAMRLLVDVPGDVLGASPLVGSLALAIVLLAPPAFLFTTFLAAFLGLVAGHGWLMLFWLLTLPCALLWVPAYYWACFTGEIPRLHWKLELPFKTDATMRAQETILRTKISIFLSDLRFQRQLESYAKLASPCDAPSLINAFQ